MQVFILAGQSNMVGGARADNGELPAGQGHIFPEVLYKQNTNHGVEGWGPLQPRTVGDNILRWFGPELTFGETLLNSGVENPAIIKFARDGSSLAKSWCPGTGPCPDDGPVSLRPQFYDFIDSSLAELTNLGHTYEIAGFVWVQGSGDAGVLERAEAYDENLAQFADEIRGIYGSMPTIINRYHIDSNRGFVDELRISQREFGDADPNAYVIHTDDLQLKSDDIHFTTGMHLEVGRRLADRYLESLGLRGDYNRDGVVDATDYALWRESLGSLAALRSDGDGDGVVDDDDFVVWQNAFGRTAPAASQTAVTTAPEPTAALLAVLLLASISGGRSRRFMSPLSGKQ